jgi:hypothetical protein
MTGGLSAMVARAIAEAPIRREPFPHIIVSPLLPADLYEQVRQAIPDRASLEQVEYPGTGFGRRNRRYHDHGLAYRDLARATGPLEAIASLFSSDEFTDALLTKFATPLDDGFLPIPEVKHRFFADGADDYTSVFDLQVDLPGYAIAPHRDVDEKIVTYQLYLTPDDSLAEFGTLLCRPKDARAQRGRRRSVAAVGEFVDRLPAESRVHRRIERSRLGRVLGVGSNRVWLPWSWFTVDAIAYATPNSLLAFAPNERSFHAVDLRIPRESPVQQREVVRGFIRTGGNTTNWIAPRRPERRRASR